MKISIITACFNSASTILDTLESVRSQTYDNYELIVVDGGSTDGTVAMLADYEKHFGGRLRWISEPDKGIYDAMNKGILMSTGDIIGCLNSDDYYKDPAVLGDIAAAFQANPGIDAVHGNLDFINEKHEVVRVWRGSPYQHGIFNTGWAPAHPTFYCKRSCFERFGVFDASLSCSADFELMLRFIEKEKIITCYMDRNMVNMRVGGESTSGIKSLMKSRIQLNSAFKMNNLTIPFLYYEIRVLRKLKNLICSKLRMS